MLTHKMVRDRGLVDNSSPSQLNSVSPASRHYFPCIADDVSASTLTDIIGGIVIDPVAQTDHSVGAGATNTVRVQSYPTDIGITGAWDAIGSNDGIILVAAKARFDTGHADSNYGGFISFYVGTIETVILRVQPYYSHFFAGTDETQTNTPEYDPNFIRNDGQDYIFAAVKRGNILEHWADGVLRGTVDITDSSSDLQADWSTMAPGAKIANSHSRYDQDGTMKSGEYPQDYYGFLYMVFEDGAPNDIGVAMDWNLDDWKNVPAGEKRIYPSWITTK